MSIFRLSASMHACMHDVKNTVLKSEVVPFSFLDRFCKDGSKIQAVEALYLHYFICVRIPSYA